MKTTLAFLSLKNKGNDDLSFCPTYLNHDYIGDSFCDDGLNVDECLFDGGDCCQPIGSFYCTHCTAEACICNATGQRHCTLVPGNELMTLNLPPNDNNSEFM